MELGASGLEFRGVPGQCRGVHQAFILGAGLGTRLRPLTHRYPKPLVPLFHRPLAEWAMDACRRVGVERFAINTHHLPEAWQGLAARHSEVSLFHEPILLETGGGLKNIEPWVADGSLLVHNGDIFSDMPLERLVDAHRRSGLPVTLALRSHGVAKHIALDGTMSRVTDIRSMLGRAEGTHVFTGIYCIERAFLERIPPNEKVSVIPAFLALVREGLLGAVVIDDGSWLDLGDREAYLRAHRELDLGPAVAAGAVIDPQAVVENSVIGEGVVVPAGAVIRGSVIWPGARLEPGVELVDCIVCSRESLAGRHQNEDC